MRGLAVAARLALALGLGLAPAVARGEEAGEVAEPPPAEPDEEAGGSESGDAPPDGEPPEPELAREAGPGEAEGEEGRSSARYVLDAVEIRGNTRTRDSVIRREVPFRRGEVLDLDDTRIEATRYRLLATGYFTDVHLSLRRGRSRGHVVLVVDVTERWTLVVHDIALGLSDIDYIPYGGLHVGEINFLGLGISLSGAFVAGEDQQAYRIRASDPRFLDSRWALAGELLYSAARDFLGRRPVLISGVDEPRSYATVTYERIGGSIGTGFRLLPTVSVYLDYRLELVRARLPAAAAQLGTTLGSTIGEPIEFHLLPGRSILSAFVVTLEHDTRDHAFLPSRGFHVAGAVTFASDVIGSSYHYVKTTLQADVYVPLPWRHTVHLGLLTGAIFGDAPLYEMYFIGDLSDQIPSRVLDLNFSHAPAPNIFRTSVEEMRYESLAGRLDVEYIVPLYRGRSVVYGLDFFLLLGLYSIGSPEDFVSAPTGYRGGPFPIDMTLDLGFRLDTLAGVFGFSFQNLLGLIPFNED